MLAVISPLIARGVIDNTARGLIDLQLWCTDGLEPLHMRMRGDCLRDIAGCRLEFTNTGAGSPPAQVPELLTALRSHSHNYTAGDITFSRRTQDNDNRGAISNLLSIEIFVNEEARLLVELSSIPFSISLPQWEQSWEDDNVQRILNMEALRAHININVAKYRGPGIAGLGADMPPCIWDYRLNKAEAYMAIYPSIHDKYGPVPGGYLSAAFVMERTDFLGREAAADEANMPPDPEVMNHDWEVLDFLPKEQAKAVRKSMHHKLFREASHMTALVQQLLLHGSEKLKSSKEAADFLSAYASIVSHTLATILLTEEDNYDTELADHRIRVLMARIQGLRALTGPLPAPCREPICKAADQFLSNMQHFSTSLRH